MKSSLSNIRSKYLNHIFEDYSVFIFNRFC